MRPPLFANRSVTIQAWRWAELTDPGWFRDMLAYHHAFAPAWQVVLGLPVALAPEPGTRWTVVARRLGHTHATEDAP